MKSTLLIFTLLCSQLLFSQTKILFDASKAESAGNADWVIDADAHNLGYNPGPYIGGHESNAQRTPTPSQSGINSNKKENYWTGGISAWAIDAVKQGYHVESLPYNGSITYNNSSNAQDLSNYDVFVVCEPNIKFTSSEKTAMMNFVKNGGGLFMVSDHNNSDRNGDGYDSPAIWNDFIKNNSVQNYPFGFTFDYEFFSESTNNIPNLPGDPLLHGSYGNVTAVAFYGGTSLTLNHSHNASVKGVVYRNGYSNTGNNGVLCAYATYGSGKVVAIGDSSPADDGTGDSGDNLYDGWIADANGNHERLFMNATIWLAQGPTGMVPNNQSNKLKVVLFNANGSTFFNIKTPNLDGFTLTIYDVSGRKIVTKTDLQSGQSYGIVLPAHGLFPYLLTKDGKMLKSGKIVQ